MSFKIERKKNKIKPTKLRKVKFREFKEKNVNYISIKVNLKRKISKRSFFIFIKLKSKIL